MPSPETPLRNPCGCCSYNNSGCAKSCFEMLQVKPWAAASTVLVLQLVPVELTAPLSGRSEDQNARARMFSAWGLLAREETAQVSPPLAMKSQSYRREPNP